MERAILSLIMVYCSSITLFGQFSPHPARRASLCSLQQTAAQGSHQDVRVSGIYSDGLDLGTLRDDACSRDATWVELSLRTAKNKAKLRRLLETSHKAYVVFDGEFYGPPIPDPKLPEPIRESYHPGWGHLAAFNTKLIVREIHEVRPVSTE